MFNQIINFLIPPSCVYCGAYEGSYICQYCSNKLKQYEPESFISRKTSKNWEVEKDLRNTSNLEKVFYFYHYNKVLHALIVKYKYSFYFNLAIEICGLIYSATESQKINFSEFDLITFVPISKEREDWRGFNHVKIITQNISEKLQIPFCQILTKPKHTKAQIDLKREDRLENLKDVFEIRSALPINLSNQRILIIDDVLTTGSTLEECAKTIRATFPDVKITGMCLARGE